MDWKFHNGKKDDPSWHTEYFEHLRKHINPLCDCYNPCRGFIDGVVIILLALFLSFGIMLLRSFAFIIPTAYIVDYFFGNILRDQFNCHFANATEAMEEISKSTLPYICFPIFGPKMEEILQLWIILLAVFVVTYYASSLGYQPTIIYLITFLSKVSGYTFAMVFLPWFLEGYTVFTPSLVKYFILVLLLVVWVFFPSIREKAFHFFVVLLFAYFVKWRVFKTSMFGFQYTHKDFWILVWVCGIILWLHPYLGLLQLRGFHLFTE